MTRLLSVVGLAWLYCTIGELQPIEYLKCVFLEILNVTTWSVFQNKVTYAQIATFMEWKQFGLSMPKIGLAVSYMHSAKCGNKILTQLKN